MTVESASLADDRRKRFVLQEIQPGLLGLMDGSMSTLALISATAGSDVSAQAVPQRHAHNSKGVLS
jgi:hypothetical protein